MRFMLRKILFSATVVLGALISIPAHSQINAATDVRWPTITGSGVPSLTCAAPNYGQPYQNTAVIPNTIYHCASDGWELEAATGAVSGQTINCIPKASGAAALTGPSSVCDNGTSITASEPFNLFNLTSDLPVGSQVADANAAVTSFSVLAFGAKSDLLPAPGSFIQCTLTNGNATISCPSAHFLTTASVNQYSYFHNLTTTPFATTPAVAQIVAIIDDTHITLDGSHVPNSTTTPFISWGTDNTPAFNLCRQAVQNLPSHVGNCTVPAGNYLLATAPYPTVFGARDDGAYFTGGSAGGSGAAITCSIAGGGLSSCTVSGGTLYTPNSTLQTSISGGCTSSQICGQAWVTVSTNSSGVPISPATIVYPGWGFTSAPTVAIVKLGGDGATATATVTAGTMNTPTIVLGGGGYTASSTLNWYALNSGGSTCATTATFGGTPIVGKGTIATNSNGAASGAMAVTTNATGCGATPPIIIFGDYPCNSGTLVSPVWGQCSNVAPLTPATIPVQIPMVPGVSWVGVSGANSGAVNVVSPWDGVSVDNNEYVIMGGQIQAADILNLTFSGFLGIMGTNNVNYSNIIGDYFNTGIGMLTGSTDIGAKFGILNFAGYISWVNGGTWASRADFPQGNGGFYDAYSVDTVTIRGSGGGLTAIASKFDDWFANNFWRPEFSAYSTDFLETCAFPQTPNQRQTGHSLSDSGHVANTMCLRGPSGAGLSIFTRDNRNTGAPTITNVISKNNYRSIFQGNSGGMQATNLECEACTALTGTNDPYRSATQLEGALIITDGTGSSVSHNANINGVGWAGSTINRAIWSISAQGDPSATAYINNSGSTVTNSQFIQNPQFQDKIPFYGGLAIQTSPGLTRPIDFYSWYSNANHFMGSWVGRTSATGDCWRATDGSTCTFEVGDNFVTADQPFTAITNIKLLSGGTAMTGNQGTGLLLQHSTGSITTNDLVKFDASGNTVDAGAFTKVSTSQTPAAATASSCVEQTFTFTGVATGQSVNVSPPASLGVHLWIGWARVSATNTVAIGFCGDATAGTPPSGTYVVMAF